MKRILPFAAGLLLTAALAARADTPDYFAPRAGLDADTVLLLDARSGRAETIEKLRARLKCCAITRP